MDPKPCRFLLTTTRAICSSEVQGEEEELPLGDEQILEARAARVRRPANG